MTRPINKWEQLPQIRKALDETLEKLEITHKEFSAMRKAGEDTDIILNTLTQILTGVDHEQETPKIIHSTTNQSGC